MKPYKHDVELKMRGRIPQVKKEKYHAKLIS